jgi:APA family basic amino acid/polyamine antiporter
MSEEAKQPRRLIPRAIALVVIAVMVIYSGLPSVALSALPVTHDAHGYHTQLADQYAGDPILGIVKNMNLGFAQTAAEYYVGVLAATILLIASNAGIIGVSRLTYSMGQHQQLPDRVRQISPRFRTPANGILIFGLIACLVIIPGQEEFLGTLYAFGAMLSFTIAHIALIGLRWRLSHNKMREIPGDVEVGEEGEWYKAPLNIRFRGVELPLFAVIGGLGTFAAWIAVMALYTDALIVGAIWLVLGFATYVLYRRRKGLSLTETTVVKLPTPVGAEPVRYAAVLVAFEDGTYSESAMAVALKLAAHKRGDVRVISTITVPPALDLDAPLPEAEATAAAVIETARQWAGRGQRIRGRIVRIRPGEAGHKIVREAIEAHSDAIVMPMPRRRPSPGKILSPTLSVVLAKRPCRVIIDSEPAYPLTEVTKAAA